MKKAIFSIVAAAALTGSFSAKADAQEVIVKKGDTLWDISQGYKVSVEQVKDWNGLSSDSIYPGQELKVSPERKPYIIKKGDTLWDIAKDNEVTVENLKDWNDIKTDLIYPNQKIAFNSVQGPKASAQQQKETAGKTLTAKSTAYTAYCEGCIGITKTGVNLRENPEEKVIAVDPNVIPLGSKVHVEGYGYATAADIGGAIDGNEIDVFFPSEQSALKWGVKSVKVTILN